MHKAIGKLVEKQMGDAEKKAPLKSLKFKIKFQSVEDKKEAMAKKKR